MVSALLVEGNSTVSGRIKAAGAKNAALPILSAALLLDGVVRLSRVPDLCDVTNLIELLGYLGVRFLMKDDMTLQIDAAKITEFNVPNELVNKMRASFLVLGPLLARVGRAKVPFPGGCAIGVRPLDLHIFGLQQLGAKIVVHDDCVEATAPAGGLRGGVVDFDFPSVTATENIIMAAVLAKGVTTINGAAREPEVVDLVNFLNKVGADIKGAGSNKIVIKGVERLNSDHDYSIMGDRVEVGTFLIAATMTGGDIEIMGIDPQVLESPLQHLRLAGAEISCGVDSIKLNMLDKKLRAVSITTAPYPGFPTDLQAQWLALNIVAIGESKVKEQVFENRLKHVAAMNAMGAELFMQDRVVISQGNKRLQSAEVFATDLRASAGLVLAGLVADGVTKINDIYHIDRGYEHIESKFNSLGCNVFRVDG